MVSRLLPFKEVTASSGQGPQRQELGSPDSFSYQGGLSPISSMKGDIINQLIPWGLLTTSQSQNEVWSRVKPVGKGGGRRKG